MVFARSKAAGRRICDAATLTVMRMLILGGTAFLGRALARQAVAQGIEVTALARGSAPVPDGVRFIRADRDRDDALVPVAHEQWDAIVDLTRQPGHARRAATGLHARHRILISSANVYARFDQPEQSEDAALLAPLDADELPDMSHYGEAKVACEQAVSLAARRDGSTATIIRAGLIGGYGDWSGRSGYYPWRFAHPTGRDVLVPPDLDFPVALIDVDDLVAWVLQCAERRVDGVFNATGETTTLGHLLDICKGVAASPARPRPVETHHLAAAGIGAWMGTPSLPLWIDDPDWRWFATLDTRAARAAGLHTRPLAETLRSALAYEQQREVARATGLTEDEEHALRARLTGHTTLT